MSIGSDLLRFSDRKLIFFDKEAQRVNRMHDNLPFELAWVEAIRDRVLKTHQYYLAWPVNEYCRRMSADAARITRFHRGMIEGGDDPEFVLDAWESYALSEEYLLVGQHILGYDFDVWNLWREALGRPKTFAWRNRVLDTNVLARAWKMGWKPDRSSPQAFMAWQYKVMNTPVKGVKTNQAQLCKDLGIEVDESKLHGAAYDLYLNVQINWKLVNLIEV